MTEHDSDTESGRAAAVQRIIRNLDPDSHRWSGDKADDWITATRGDDTTTLVLEADAHSDAPGDVARVEAHAYDGRVPVVHGDTEKPRLAVYVCTGDGSRFIRHIPADTGHEKLDALLYAIDDWETLDTDWMYR